MVETSRGPHSAAQVVLVAVLVLVTACGALPGEDLPDRQPGERAPLTRSCSALDPQRCLLPWPNSAFSRVDSESATGIRLQIDAASLPVEENPGEVNRADGFSRLTALATVLAGPATAATWDPAPSLTAQGPFQLINAQPDSDAYGERVALRVDTVELGRPDAQRWLLVGHPAQVLEAGAEYVAVVLGAVGTTEQAPPAVRIALGLDAATTDGDRALRAYHGPTRALLEVAGIDAAEVVRVWDFTTRSAEDPLGDIDHLRQALGDAAPEIVIDAVEQPEHPDIELIVTGHLRDAPGFLNELGRFERGDDGLPLQLGATDIPFRVVVPVGEGDYPIALYGHGSGGDLQDDSFDEDLAGIGFAKVNLRFRGFTGPEVVGSFASFSHALDGTATMVAGLAVSLAGGSAVLDALTGPLGDLLAAAEIGGQANPAAGRRPRSDVFQWVGGSLGGMMGGVISASEPRIDGALLNVPGAGWSRMTLLSSTYEQLIEPLASVTYADTLDLQLDLIISQTSWDAVDGGAWHSGRPRSSGVVLLQESLGDPVMPNMSTELLAQAIGARQFEPFTEVVPNLDSTASSVTSGAALEQFRVYYEGELDVHGFAALHTPAGDAAVEQVLQLLTTTLAGAPEVTHPSTCVAVGVEGRCDFPDVF